MNAAASAILTGIGVNDALATVGGALIGAAISGIADAYVQDTTYTIVTDKVQLRIGSRTPARFSVRRSMRHQAGIRRYTK